MRRLLLVALSVLLVGMVPASAEESPELVECDNPDDLEVITREGLESDIATPSWLVGNEVEYKEFLLDLSPATADLDGTLTTTMTWMVRANDYDLSVYSSRGSASTEDYQPFEDAVEQATIAARHCDVVEVGAIDFLSPVVVDSLALDFQVSAPEVIVEDGELDSGE